MDWWFKAMLTSLSVAAVLTISRKFGQRIGGVVAGLPLITAQTLMWVALDHDTGFAGETAAGIVAGTGMVAVFVLVYVWFSRHFHVMFTAPYSLVIASPSLIPALSFHASPVLAFACTLGFCVLGLSCVRSRTAHVAVARVSRVAVALSIVTVGLISATISTQADLLGSFCSGLLATLPIGGATVIINYHLLNKHAAIRGFVHGYLSGLIGQASFAATFGFAVTQMSSGIALLLSLMVAIAATAIASRASSRLARKQSLQRVRRRIPTELKTTYRDLREHAKS
jgi:hypothetical protein